MFAGDITFRLVQESGFNASQLITPGATFLGAVLGVVVGGLLTRKTLFAVETKRASIDDERDNRRRQQDEAAEKRRVRGTARSLRIDLEHALVTLNVSKQRSQWWPQRHTVRIEFGREEQTLVATWFNPHGWDLIAIALHALVDADVQRTHMPDGIPSAAADEFDFMIKAIQDAVAVIDQEIVRLGPLDQPA
ncbi:hypothetical protein OJ997_29445 [Solirubrobacter phytolaccae]|uniref:Uncharacterized protein n=1 Tax=Solirubrobacter phytolaccae TaxID=1404360 RepID=A0A9X3ND50_9ACTN|nr:hypothetical protein [Solirubrobacter phytolaccae]MDA0184465.1 hypothetical protein [Solirubrobacter phytolaccae]